MLKITEPFHGAVVNRRHGEASDGGLKIIVRGEAPLRDKVTVNGQPAQQAGAAFSAEVVLREKETDIVAVAAGARGRQEHRVRVVWDRHSKPRYRFSIDDNSFFLRDIFKQGYKSLFDCFYPAGLRDLNRKYGAKFVLNIYYATDDGFELPQFSDRYKGEWRDNANWLKLAFHAYTDKPDRPYQYATGQKLGNDLDAVAGQIRRFAGEEVYTPPTVIHWGMLQPAVLPVLAKRGVRVLSGMFRRTSGGYDVNYMLDDDRSEWLSRNEALKDFETGIVFSMIDLVCNNTPLDRIVPMLEAVARDANRAEIMDLFTHEQYFWPFFKAYLPDHFQRLDAALRWVTEHGYAPVFFHEGLLGGAESMDSREFSP
ncbi:MAG: hypothetical protein HZA91_06625 [Verrucomicrobia bacterium]|nr:hypothetical protein [Verrucomicrobiota bacterium]